MNFSSEYSDISSGLVILAVSRGHGGVRAGILNDAERGGGDGKRRKRDEEKNR